MQGVSINLFVNAKQERYLTPVLERAYGRVFYHEIYGQVTKKYNYLNRHTISSISWKEVPTCTEHWNYHFMIPKNFEYLILYERIFSTLSLSKCTTEDFSSGLHYWMG